MKKFTSDFLLGASTAAHQVEGNNILLCFTAIEDSSIQAGYFTANWSKQE